MTRNHRCEYTATTCLMAVIIVGCFLSFRDSTVPNLIPRNIVTRKAILLMYMMSIHRVTSRYCSIIVRGTSCQSIATCLPLRRSIFPFNDPKLGPNMSSAAMISSVVMGQFFNRFCFTIFIKFLINSHPTVFCLFLASNAL